MTGKNKTILLSAVLAVFGMLTVMACQVPVFRYALERWPADVYSIRVIAGDEGGTLSDTEQKIVSYLNEAKANLDSLPNFKLEVTPVGAGEEPRLEIRYPQKISSIEPLLIWQGDLTVENAMRAVDSPMRRELAKRILSGQSVVWVFLPGSDSQVNQELRELLDATLAKAGEKIKIPDGVVTNEDIKTDSFSGDPDDIVNSGVPLIIDFSVMELSRDQPEEQILISMFLNLEDDLYEFPDAPMVFPVFGRGRALEPLIGRGINRDTIYEYCGYLCGACSCEVKSQNPGMDLLVSANWDSAIEGSSVFEEVTLPSIEDFTDSNEQNDDIVTFTPGSETPVLALTNWRMIAGVVLLFLGVGTLVIKRNAN